MNTAPTARTSHKPSMSVAHKVWREVSRPVRRLSQRMTSAGASAAVSQAAPVVAGFDPTECTVEPAGVAFIKKLVRQSQQFPGPIIEIGTLMGITTSHMALAKAPGQKIITVDLYCWNPWGLPPEVHEKFTAQMLHYLVEAGHVERLRMDKDEFYRTYRGPAPAMVFLDAMHDYEATKKDIEWAQNAGARIISGHDYCDKHPGVVEIVDELGGPRELGGTVWAL